MTTTTGTVTPAISVGLGYKDAQAAHRWLIDVLGFRVTALFDDGQGGVAFSQVAWKDGAVHVHTDRGPGRMPPTGPSSIALTCASPEEVDRLYERALAAGAEVLLPVEDTHYGNHGFSLRDPEGNLWHVGIDHLATEQSRSMPQRRI